MMTCKPRRVDRITLGLDGDDAFTGDDDFSGVDLTGVDPTSGVDASFGNHFNKVACIL